MTKLLKATLALLVAGGGLLASGSAFAVFPAPYCVRGYSSEVEPITKVTIDGINNSSSATVNFTNTGADEDYTAIIGALAPGGTYPISVAANTDGNFSDAIAVYIDWDQNGTFDAGEGYVVGTISNSTGLDTKTASSSIVVPAGALLGPTRMRVTHQNATITGTLADAPACGTTGFGQAEDYTVNIDTAAAVPPSVSESFAPTNAPAPATSTLTLTLGNTSLSAAVLTADFVDTLPSGMILDTPANGASTCSGTLTATSGAGTFTLATGASIPVGGCTISVNVATAASGIFFNVIPAGAIATSQGGANAASATFQATQAGSLTYSTGFETPTFVVGNLAAQGGWGRSGGAAADLKISTVNPGAGAQHLRSTWATASTGTVAAISPTQPVGTTTYAIASAKLAIKQNAAANGTEWDFTPQDPGAGSITTRVHFLRPTAGVNKIQVLDPNGGGPGVAAYVDTGSFWTDGVYFEIKVIANRAAQTSQICINGASIFTVNGFAKNVANLAITGTKGAGTNGNTLDVDDVVIDNSNIGTCNGLAAPTIAKSFTPSSVLTNTNSSATITLTNPNASAITLSADLVDTLPAGLVASAAATTCTGTATFTAGSLTLGTGATVPANGSCTLTGTVQAAATGSFVNTIAAGDLQTNAGNNAAAATATLTVTAPLVAPTIAKSFTPASVSTATNSTATITLTNPNASVATLSAALVDTLPAGLVASAAATTCGGSASFTAGSITLGTGATIPASGSCTVTGTVQAAAAGSYVNTIAAGALQTDAGNNAAAATATLTVTAAGGLVCSAPINHAIATDIDGSYFGWVSGTVSDNSFAGYNFNPYGSSGKLAFFWGTGSAGVATTASTGTDWLVLHTGDIVGSSSTFSNGVGAATNWDATSNGYLGFKFTCAAGTCYGYTHMTSVGPNGFPANLVDYCYDSSGASVTVPALPLVAPTVAKSFTPASVVVNTNSTATITLSNTNASVATLTANLVDTLPAGLVASAASTTCGGPASFTAGSLTLASGATIPANGSCTLTGTVQSAAAGSFINTIAAGGLQTDAGNNAAAATATLTVTAGGAPVANITPASLTFSVQAGANTAGPLSIGNTGTATLNWSLTEAAAIPQSNGYVPNAKSLPSPAEFSREHAASGVQMPTRPNPAPKAVAIDEGFDDITLLPGAGWLQINHSNPLGLTDWAQGGGVAAGGPFDAFDGAATAFISANYNNSGDGTLSNWLVTPSVSFNAGSSVSFYTRSASANFPDRLEVRLCTTGACTNVGTSETDVGDFGTLLLSVNPNLVAAGDPTGVNGYPISWAQFNITTGLPSSGTGRIAFRYFVTDAGPDGANSNYIGIDRVVVDNGSGGGGGCGSPSNIPWLSESLTSGAVAAGNADVSNVTVDATSLAAGTYSAHICVATDDPAHALVDVPVTVTVTPAPFVACSAGSDEIFCDGFEDAVVGTCTPTQLFADPGFEIGAGADGAWTSVDSQFGTSYCDASCDATATITPHGGNWFVWFGGAAAANTATLTQAVTFPSGQARWLNYWLIDQISGDPTATLTVMIDGTQVLNVVGGTPSQTYAAQTFPIPAVYLDGASHSVSFNWSAASPAGEIGGAMVDDVTLDCSAQSTRPASNPGPVSAAIRRSIH